MRSSSGAAIPWSARSAYIFRAPDLWLRQPNCQHWGVQNTGVGKVRSGARRVDHVAEGERRLPAQ